MVYQPYCSCGDYVGAFDCKGYGGFNTGYGSSNNGAYGIDSYICDGNAIYEEGSAYGRIEVGERRPIPKGIGLLCLVV